MLKNLGKVNFVMLGFIYTYEMKIAYPGVSIIDQNLHFQKVVLQ